jgi:hypothetical protein
MSDKEEVKKKFTPAYAEYQLYLQEVLADEDAAPEKEKNEIQEFLPRESDKK